MISPARSFVMRSVIRSITGVITDAIHVGVITDAIHASPLRPLAPRATLDPMTSQIAWILTGGLLMTVLAFSGGLCLFFSERTQNALVTPLMALASGTLFGGAMFHLLPQAVAHMGPGVEPFVWMSVGFTAFMLIEVVLHAHRHGHVRHDGPAPFTYLVLIGDGLHNFLGGLAIGATFLLDPRVGVTAWLAAVAHELPQELGDFGALIAGGFSPRAALTWNFVSALAFPLGGVVAWMTASDVDVTFLIAVGAGNFLYIASVDLLPELFQRSRRLQAVWILVFFGLGMGLMGGLHGFVHGAR